ncbi:MAG: phosphoglycerate kinase, partial [Candidatus Pelagibacter sp.]
MSQYKILDKNSTKNKIILIRVDFNVPIDNKKIQDITRINKMKEIIHNHINNNNKVVLCSHLGRPKKNKKEDLSFLPIKNEIEKALESKIDFEDVEKIEKTKIKKSNKNIFLLENIRFYPGEETNNDEFSKKLASLADIYINEAFSCSHRSHASINGITKYIDSYAGETVIEEINALNKIITQTEKPVACLIGGSKISTKIDLIINLLPKMDYMIIGGAMANNFLKYDNINIGKSYVEQVDISIVKSIHQVANRCGCKIILPTDVIVSQNLDTEGILKKLNELNNDDCIFDIGNETIKII